MRARIQLKPQAGIAQLSGSTPAQRADDDHCTTFLPSCGIGTTASAGTKRTDPAAFIHSACITSKRPNGDLPARQDTSGDQAVRLGEQVQATYRVTATGDPVGMLADEIWLATGTAPDAIRDPVLRQLQGASPTRIVGGYCVTDNDTLAWPGLAVHLLGRSASLSLGPAAGESSCSGPSCTCLIACGLPA